MPKLSWKREPKQTRLAAIGAAPRGYELHSGETVYATVSSLGGGFRGPETGWYWVAGWGSDVPHKNTCGTPCETPEEAKKQALEYVKANLPKPLDSSLLLCYSSGHQRRTSMDTQDNRLLVEGGSMRETSIKKAARGWPVVNKSIVRTEFFIAEEGGLFVMAADAYRLECEFAALTAAKELAERQVALLCKLIDKETRLEYCSYCPARCVCHGATQCEKTLAAWSRAEVEEGVTVSKPADALAT